MCCCAGVARWARHDARASCSPSYALVRARTDRRPRLYDGAGITSAAGAARSAGNQDAVQMSIGYRAVQWNARKLRYDTLLIACAMLFIATFMIVGALRNPPADPPAWIALRIKALGTCAFVMLTIILTIGPLARLDRRFLPLLYNRRHFGVATFIAALLHVGFMLEWYAVQGNLPDLITELTTWADYGKFIGFPFKVLGIAAVIVLFLMAATSHDFWLNFLTPPVWKALHMALYVAYGLAAMHVALGVMQYDRNPVI